MDDGSRSRTPAPARSAGTGPAASRATPEDHPGFHVVADDLSGAAETAAALLPGFSGARIELSGTSSTAPRRTGPGAARSAHPPPPLCVTDVDCRYASAAAAERAVRAELGTHPQRRAFVKIDSLLRGNVAAVLAALDAPVVLAPALPGGGRTVRAGVLHVGGVPLHRSEAWEAEDTAPPTSVAAAAAPERCRTVPLSTVRSARLPQVLRECAASGEIPVCDGETESDVDAAAAAALDVPGVRLVGSGGLAAAVGRHLPPARTRPRSTPNPAHALLFVIGTAHAGASEQIRRLDARVQRFPLEVSDLLAGSEPAEQIARALRHRPVALVLRSSSGPDPARSREIVRRLAAAAGRAVRAAAIPVDLVLTGGETARRVLDALGVTALTPVGEVHHGAVHSRTTAGTSVVTRPGGFGGADSLARIAAALRPAMKG
ncbi:four-carbon acid sugar kinase family protein [Salinifilum ghardaiensis]